MRPVAPAAHDRAYLRENRYTIPTLSAALPTARNAPRRAIKDPYNFEFLGLLREAKERDLEQALLNDVQSSHGVDDTLFVEVKTNARDPAVAGRSIHCGLARARLSSVHV
jgi:hypothetical protein